MKILKLKGKITESGMTQGDFAKAIGINRSTLSRKMKSGEEFTIGEVNRITEVLCLSGEEAKDIFLPV